VCVACRKHGSCCGRSAAEAGDDASPPDSPIIDDFKPHYYSGVTVDDLRHADELDDDDEQGAAPIVYVEDGVTTPPPDVVPVHADELELSTASDRRHHQRQQQQPEIPTEPYIEYRF